MSEWVSERVNTVSVSEWIPHYPQSLKVAEISPIAWKGNGRETVKYESQTYDLGPTEKFHNKNASIQQSSTQNWERLKVGRQQIINNTRNTGYMHKKMTKIAGRTQCCGFLDRSMIGLFELLKDLFGLKYRILCLKDVEGFIFSGPTNEIRFFRNLEDLKQINGIF